MVVAVEGIEKSTVFADESSFGRRGTGINTEIAVSFVGGKIGGHDVVDTLARQKFVILGLIFKQRLKKMCIRDSNCTSSTLVFLGTAKSAATCAMYLQVHPCKGCP